MKFKRITFVSKLIKYEQFIKRKERNKYRN